MHPPARSPRPPAPALSTCAAAFCLTPGMLYLDSAAQGPRLRSVMAAGHQALDDSTRPWQLGYGDWLQQIESLRRQAADTVFEGDVDGVAMVPSAAFALATAARNLPLRAGEAVMVLDGQFPSNLLAWQVRAREVGAHIVAVQRTPRQDWTEAVIETLRAGPHIRIAALPQAHWHHGALLDLDRIAPILHAAGIALVLDLSQSLGVLPARLAAWQPAFVASVGHKWLLGPTGLAWLWADPHWREHGVPIEQHWSARAPEGEWSFPAAAAPRYQAGARRFDAGGITDPGRLAMASAALAQIADWGPTAIAARLDQLTRGLRQGLQARELGHWQAQGHAPHFTALRVPAAQLDLVATALYAAGIVCTRRAGLLRIAPHLHVDETDLQRLVDAIPQGR